MGDKDGRAPDLPRHAVDRAWDLVEELTFTRDVPPVRSRVDVATEVGVSEMSLHGWEAGSWLPGLAAFVAWADALGYDVDLVSRGG